MDARGESVLQDVRYSWRLLRRAPVFTAIAIVTLALGIGANTAIFSIVSSVILRPLPYPSPAELMYLTTEFPGLGLSEFWVSPPEYMEFREINRSFAEVGAYTTGEVNLTAGDRAIRVRSAAVDEHLLRALGVRPAQGRLFADGETTISAPVPQPGQPAPPSPPPAVAILSYELWQSAFGGRPIVGDGIDVNGRRHQVLGIMERGADVMDNRTEIWMPLGLNPANRQNRGNHFLYVIGRLKAGVNADAATAELEALMKNWGERVGATAHTFARPGHYLQMEPMQAQVLGGAGRAIWVLQAAVGLVLLIACANLANLLLARAERRHREFAVRTALGAGRLRLLRQFVTEGLLVSTAGGILGIGLAIVGVRALVRAYPASLPRTSEVGVDPAALFFTLAVSVATGLLFGLAPLMHTRLASLAPALKEGGDRGATSGARHGLRRTLVVAEVSVAVMLVVGAALLVRTVYNLVNVDAGFNRERLVTFSITLPPASYPQAVRRGQLYQRVLDELRAVTGIQAATAMSGLPPDRPLNANDTDIDQYTAPPEGPFENVDYYQTVMSDYFETMGIPIVQGRGFEAADVASSGPVAVVNEALVERFWKGQNPIGRRLRPGFGPQIPWFTVVGVARDVKQGGIDKEAGTELYFFGDQLLTQPPPLANAPVTMNVVLRTAREPAAIAREVERVVRGADPAVPIVRLREMDAVFAESIRRPRLMAQLGSAFAGLALLLAALGTYGVLSYLVAERRRDIGIRLALGAERRDVLAQVMKQGLLLAGIGIAIGLAGAFALNRLLAALLFGVAPTDPSATAAAVAAMALAAAAACWLPAWRASRLNPIVVLRDE
jgi:putative ABC transport system permease protein